VSNILLKPGSPAQSDAKLNAMSIKDLANELQDVVVEITRKVRGFVNERAWLDWILERLRFENVHNDYDDEVGAKPEEYTISHSISRVLKPQFYEHWAGEIMDSWRGSVMGLAGLEEKRKSFC
jgi:N-terminal acetyltransferase B complex non-catalytic subunit